jgi:hypothetical protein
MCFPADPTKFTRHYHGTSIKMGIYSSRQAHCLLARTRRDGISPGYDLSSDEPEDSRYHRIRCHKLTRPLSLFSRMRREAVCGGGGGGE